MPAFGNGAELTRIERGASWRAAELLGAAMIHETSWRFIRREPQTPPDGRIGVGSTHLLRMQIDRRIGVAFPDP
jgi:hypothetical protein